MYQFFERSELSTADYEELFHFAQQEGIALFSTPFDEASLKLLVEMGAVMIEKHFTLDRKLPGADNAISMEPTGLRELQTALVNVNQILGDGRKTLQASEQPVKQSARWSLVAKVDIEPHTQLTESMLTAKRPGTACRVVPRVSHIKYSPLRL